MWRCSHGASACVDLVVHESTHGRPTIQLCAGGRVLGVRLVHRINKRCWLGSGLDRGRVAPQPCFRVGEPPTACSIELSVCPRTSLRVDQGTHGAVTVARVEQVEIH